MSRRAVYGDVPRTRKQQVVQLCIHALGLYYAGKETRGSTTTLLGYSEKQPVPAVRVTNRRSAARPELEVGLEILRPDIVDVFVLEESLEQLLEELREEEERWS